MSDETFFSSPVPAPAAPRSAPGSSAKIVPLGRYGARNAALADATPTPDQPFWKTEMDAFREAAMLRALADPDLDLDFGFDDPCDFFAQSAFTRPGLVHPGAERRMQGLFDHAPAYGDYGTAFDAEGDDGFGFSDGLSHTAAPWLHEDDRDFAEALRLDHDFRRRVALAAADVDLANLEGIHEGVPVYRAPAPVPTRDVSASADVGAKVIDLAAWRNRRS